MYPFDIEGEPALPIPWRLHGMKTDPEIEAARARSRALVESIRKRLQNG
jgi:hypothetical protein